MSTGITIGGTDRTSLFDSMRLRIVKNKRTFNSLRATLLSANFTIEEGEEILATIGTDLEFGGLLQDVKNNPNATQNNYNIYATSYEQITDRRTVQFSYNDTDAGDIATAMVSIMSGEGITVGNIDTGSKITMQRNAVSIRDVLDEIALASGYVWFIDNDKKLYFQDDYNYTSSTFPSDYEIVEVGRSLTGYANKVFVLGSNSIVAVSEDTTEQTKMAGRFGSGVYGVVVRDSQADTQAKAEAVADVELSKRSFDKKYIKIRTRTRIDVGEIYSSVTIPYTDISSEDYAVDEVVIECNGNGFWYTATLEPYATTILSKNDSWQNKFREFLNKSNTELESVGGGIVYVSDEEPANAATNSLWVDTDDYSRYDVATYTTSTTHPIEDGEVILASGTITVTLPEIASLTTTAGIMVFVKNIGTGTITVAGNGSETIDGSASVSLASQYDVVRLISDGANWGVY